MLTKDVVGDSHLIMRTLYSARQRAFAISLGCALTASCLLSSCANRQEDIDDWTSARHRAFESFRDNKYDDAVTQYQQAVILAEKLGTNDRRLPLTLNDLGRTYAIKEDYKNAAANYDRSLRLFESMQESANIKTDGKEVVTGLLDALEGLANANQKLGRNADAESYYRRALNLIPNGEPTRKREIIYEYRAFLASQGRTEDVHNLEIAEQNLRQESQLPNERDALYEQLNTANNEMQKCIKKNDLNGALNAGTSAVEIAEKLDNPLKLASAQTQLACMLITQQQNSQAEYMYRSALSNYQKADATDKEMYLFMLGFSRLLLMQNKAAESAPYAERVLAYAEDNHSSDEHELIEALANMVNVYAASNQLDKALSLQTRLNKMLRKHGSLTRPMVAMQTCYSANLLFLSHKNSEARKILQDYVAELKAEKPNVLPARLLTDFGSVCLAQGRSDEASEYFCASLAILKKLPAEHAEIARATEQLKATKKRS